MKKIMISLMMVVAVTTTSFAKSKCVLRQNRVRYWLYLIDFCRNF